MNYIFEEKSKQKKNNQTKTENYKKNIIAAPVPSFDR